MVVASSVFIALWIIQLTIWWVCDWNSGIGSGLGWCPNSRISGDWVELAKDFVGMGTATGWIANLIIAILAMGRSKKVRKMGIRIREDDGRIRLVEVRKF
jgi:hypothetical protein